MEKVKLAICIGDEEYQERFVRCLMNHYKNNYEIHVFSHLEEIQDVEKEKYALIIIGNYEGEALEKLLMRNQRVLCLQENEELEPEKEQVNGLVYADKYQEVYKIVDTIEILTKGDVQINGENFSTGKAYKLIGVFSLTLAHLQLPFAATLASICGERGSVLIIDMQAHSGLANSITGEGYGTGEERLGMEDLITIATTGTYTKGRILSGIGHTHKWDYVYPVKNSECLLEGNDEIYGDMLDILAKEQGYEIIIVNMGTFFPGIYDLMESCDGFYLLVAEGNAGMWREQDFTDEMIRREKDEFLHRITRIEIPAICSTDSSWQRLAEQWEWNSLGDVLREKVWMERIIG